MTISSKFFTIVLAFSLVFFALSLNGALASDYSHEDVLFRGRAFQGGSRAGFFTVRVSDSLSGKNLEGRNVRVGPFGISWCNIDVRNTSNISLGDHVEVYGLHEKVGYLDGPTVDVDICHSDNYYIKKISRDDGGNDDGNKGDGDRDKGPCKIRVSMDKKKYQPEESAKVSIETDRSLTYTLHKKGPTGPKSIETRTTPGADKTITRLRIERPEARKHLKVYAKDRRGRKCSDTFYYKVHVERNKRPTARCNCSPDSAKVGQVVKLDGSNSVDPDGYIHSYHWDVDGDGSTEAVGGEKHSRTFHEPGHHRVRLTVEDNEGAKDTATCCSLEIQEKNKKPIAKIDYDPKSLFAGDNIVLSASDSHDPDGRIDKYTWDLDDDGNIEKTGVYVDHVFDNPEKHEVTLLVRDNDGETRQDTVSINVREKSEIKIKVQDPLGNPLDANILLVGKNTKSTGEDGSTKFAKVRPATYTIQIYKTGYSKETRKITLRQGKTKFVFIELTHHSRKMAHLISNWSFHEKAQKEIILEDKSFQIYELRKDSVHSGYLPLTKKGELPASAKEYKKVSHAAYFVVPSNSSKKLKSKAESFIENADGFLNTQFAGEIILLIRNTAARLLGEVLATTASGGASAVTKEVGSNTLKQTTKHFAKRFASTLGENIVEGNLNLENAIKSYAKAKIQASKASCSKAINIIKNNQSSDQTWTFREFKSTKNNYQTCAVKLAPSMNLLSDLNPDGDVFAQLKDVSSEVVSGATGVDIDLFIELLTKTINAATCNGLCEALKDYASMRAGVKEMTDEVFLSDFEKEATENILSELKKHDYYPKEST